MDLEGPLHISELNSVIAFLSRDLIYLGKTTFVVPIQRGSETCVGNEVGVSEQQVPRDTDRLLAVLRVETRANDHGDRLRWPGLGSVDLLHSQSDRRHRRLLVE